MAEFFHGLSPAELERLALLAEECAEVIAIVNKIIRHGYANMNPLSSSKTTNRELLEKEAGHVLAALVMMSDENEDLDGKAIMRSQKAKATDVKQWLRHQ